jgi:hypothetical protein
MDGSYFTGRTLPELRESGIGEIDSAFWLPGGMEALDRVLETAGQHGVRWGFVARPEYAVLLAGQGWVYRQRLSNGIGVWENREAVRPEAERSHPYGSPAHSLSWGILPLGMLMVAFGLGFGSTQKSLRHPLRAIYGERVANRNICHPG